MTLVNLIIIAGSIYVARRAFEWGVNRSSTDRVHKQAPKL